jgi:hypothetical protein
MRAEKGNKHVLGKQQQLLLDHNHSHRSLLLLRRRLGRLRQYPLPLTFGTVDPDR